MNTTYMSGARQLAYATCDPRLCSMLLTGTEIGGLVLKHATRLVDGTHDVTCFELTPGLLASGLVLVDGDPVLCWVKYVHDRLAVVHARHFC